MSKIPQIHDSTTFPTKCASCGGNISGEWDGDSEELRGACCGHVYYGERQ